jgi:hypothetical protein
MDLMKLLLIIAAAWFALCVVVALAVWAYRLVQEIVEYFRYLAKLKEVGNKTGPIDLQQADSELRRLESAAKSLFEIIEVSHRIYDPPSSKSVSDYVQADAERQRTRRAESRRARGTSARSRKWRH